MAGGLPRRGEGWEAGPLPRPDARGSGDVHAGVADRVGHLSERAGRVPDVDDEVDHQGPTATDCCQVPRSKKGSSGGEAAPIAEISYMRRGSRQAAMSGVPKRFVSAVSARVAARERPFSDSVRRP